MGILVPTEVPSFSAALETAREKGAEDAVVRLEPNYEEPREAWPLELAAPKAGGMLLLLGPPERAAMLSDVALSGDLSKTGTPAVTVHGVVIRGRAVLNGSGCALEDCEL